MNTPIKTLALPASPIIERAVRWPVAQTSRLRPFGFFVLAVGIAALAVASLSFAIAETSEFSRFADVAVIAASADSRVIDALGSPLTPSGSPGGRWTENEARLIAGVRGSKGPGTLTATAIRTSNGWKLLELVVKTDQGRRHIVVVERTARPLPAQ